MLAKEYDHTAWLGGDLAWTCAGIVPILGKPRRRKLVKYWLTAVSPC
jgi:hypothetical protein